jgi:hypothetical protein
MAETDSRRIRALISYSHDSPEHSARVLQFAQALRRNGIAVELDQSHAEEIVDWPRWCRPQISRELCDFALCVCTAEYERRIEGRVPPQRGNGVYWEGALLDDEIYDAKGRPRLMPILFDAKPDASTPRFLRGWTLCRLSDPELTDPGFGFLVRIPTGQASVVEVEQGQVPALGPKPLPGQPRTCAPPLSPHFAHPSPSLRSGEANGGQGRAPRLRAARLVARARHPATPPSLVFLKAAASER